MQNSLAAQFTAIPCIVLQKFQCIPMGSFSLQRPFWGKGTFAGLLGLLRPVPGILLAQVHVDPCQGIKPRKRVTFLCVLLPPKPPIPESYTPTPELTYPLQDINQGQSCQGQSWEAHHQRCPPSAGAAPQLRHDWQSCSRKHLCRA